VSCVGDYCLSDCTNCSGRFGGFGPDFLREYHSVCPKTEPVEEYDDRVMLYELYHHLNHHAMFGGMYRSGAVSMIKTLLDKYGGQERADS
jgi:fructosamine-3-kinase